MLGGDLSRSPRHKLGAADILTSLGREGRHPRPRTALSSWWFRGPQSFPSPRKRPRPLGLRQLLANLGGLRVVGVDLQCLLEMLPRQRWFCILFVSLSEMTVVRRILGRFILGAQLDRFREHGNRSLIHA